MEDSVIAIIVTIVAPLITILMAKYKMETKVVKEKIKGIANVTDVVQDVLADDKVTPEELKRIITAVRNIAK